MSLTFAGNLISPAAFISLTRTKPEEKGGRPTAITTTLRMKGKLVSTVGSPRSDGSFWTSSGEPPEEQLTDTANHTSILTKQKALKNLLEQQNQILIIQPWDGSAPTKFVARLRELTFEEGTWWNVADYSATFDVDEQGFNNPGIESLSETWATEILDENLQTFKVTHTINAKGRDQHDAACNITQLAWQQAMNYALTTVGLGLDTSKMQGSGVINGFTLEAFNYNRRQNLDEVEGNFSVSEDWVAFDPQGGPTALHEQNSTVRTALDGRHTVSVEGTITGLRVSSNTTQVVTQTKATSMNSKWAAVAPTVYAAATGAFGSPALNSIPLSSQIRTNPLTGQLSYTVEYDDRLTTFPGSVAEKVTFNDTNAPTSYATIPVPGRAAGPVLQPLGTIGLRKRTISVEVNTLAATVNFIPTQPDISAYLAANAPVASQVFLDEDVISWVAADGRFNRTTAWTYQ